MNKFEYQGHMFQMLRNLTAIESGFQNIERRTGGFGNVVPIDGYSYDEFYRIAKESDVAKDLYYMDGEGIVIPHSKGLLRYDEAHRLIRDNLTYFSECCGKIVSSYKEDVKEGWLTSDEIPSGGNFYCPRCKCAVTKHGKTKRN